MTRLITAAIVVCVAVTLSHGLVLDATGSTLNEVVRIQFFMASGRPVTDKTGLMGKYNFHLEYAPDANSPRPQLNGLDGPEPTAASFFTAIQEQLGLKMEPSKGPGEYLVIDHVERPADD